MKGAIWWQPKVHSKPNCKLSIKVSHCARNSKSPKKLQIKGERLGAFSPTLPSALIGIHDNAEKTVEGLHNLNTRKLANATGMLTMANSLPKLSFPTFTIFQEAQPPNIQDLQERNTMDIFIRTF